MQPDYQRQSKTKLITTIVAVIVIAGIVVLADHLKSSKATDSAGLASSTSQTTTTPTTSSSTADTSTSGTTSTTSSAYKDGTYTASSDYAVPHGMEGISVTLTVKDGVVTDSSIVNSESDHDSAAFQEDFADAYKSYVVGQKIADLQLGIIAGASDTAEGFNEAVSQIQSQAKA